MKGKNPPNEGTSFLSQVIKDIVKIPGKKPWGFSYRTQQGEFGLKICPIPR